MRASGGRREERKKGGKAKSISEARAKRAQSAWEEERGEKEGGKGKRERRKTSRGGAKGPAAGLLAEKGPSGQLQRQLPASRGLRASFVAEEWALLAMKSPSALLSALPVQEKKQRALPRHCCRSTRREEELPKCGAG